MNAAEPIEPADPSAHDEEALRVVRAEWPAISLRLLAVAHRAVRSRDLAEDVVQEALARILEGRRRWDRAAHPDLWGFAYGVVLGVAASHRAALAVRGGPATPADPDALETAVPDPHAAQEEKEKRARQRAVLAQVRERLAGDELACGVLDLALEGVTALDEQAVRLGAGPRDLDNARRRVKRALETLVSERARKDLFRRAVGADASLFEGGLSEAWSVEVDAMTDEEIASELEAAGFDLAAIGGRGRGRGRRPRREVTRAQAVALALLLLGMFGFCVSFAVWLAFCAR